MGKSVIWIAFLYVPWQCINFINILSDSPTALMGSSQLPAAQSIDIITNNVLTLPDCGSLYEIVYLNYF